MSLTTKSDVRMRLIFALWSLLFTKCFTLEFLVRHYEVPINSVTYVWTLSILMASVATAVYANLHSDERTALIRQPGFFIHAITGLAVTVLVAYNLLVNLDAAFLLPLAAVAVGLGRIWQRLQYPSSAPIWIAPCWFVAAAILAYFGNPANFLVFAISLLILAVIPGLIQFFNNRLS